MTGAPADARGGYHHDTAFYASDDDLLALVIPFISGAGADEPVIVALGEEANHLVRRELPDPTGVTFVPSSDQYRRPATTIRSYRRLLGERVAAGARRIRAVGAVPHPGTGAAWDAWARYEAAVNHLYDDFPLWGVCVYDTRVTPDEVLADVARTHPHVLTGDGHHVESPRFEPPSAFLRRRRPVPQDPLEAGPPVLELVDPTLHSLRRAVAVIARGALADVRDVADLTVACSEVVANAGVHGRPPVTVRVWTAPGRVVVTVHDHGRGPVDPFAGLVPARRDDGRGGLGLWLAHQLCDVALVPADGGFTVRLTAGETSLPV